MVLRQILSLVLLFFSFSAFAENYNYRGQESSNILERLIKAIPSLYNTDGFIENSGHRYATSFEPSFFEALQKNHYMHPSGRNFTAQEKQQIIEKLIETSNQYIKERHTLYYEYEKFESQTYTHILRNKVLRTQIALQLEALNARLAEYHDRLKLVADVSELHKMGYPMDIMATILDFLVANQHFRKNDVSDGQILIRDKNGDLYRLPLAFGIHEVNRMEKNEVYSFFIESGLAERVSDKQIVLNAKAIISEVFDIITDHIDAISRKDLGNPSELTSASKYLSNLKKTPARELRELLSALGANLEDMRPIFDYFEGKGYAVYQQLVSYKITNIKEYTRGHNPHTLYCYILFK